jgi:hypothetical protein
MNKNIIALTSATLLTLACGSDPDPVQPGGAGASATAGSTGQGQAGMSAGGAPVSGGGGNSPGGAPAGGASTGGAGATGGASPTGGAGGNSASGAAGSGGSAPGGGSGSGGTSGGAGGGTGMSDIAKALDGMRVDDGCSGVADTSVGAVCGHAMLTASNGFKGTKQAMLAGTTGTSYDVTLRIRGIVEPTAVTGGMRPDTSTFQYRSMDWRKVPYTIGGAVSSANMSTDPDYTQWHIAVASPKQDYYLNDYQKTGHYIFKLDYQITIQVDANSAVTLDGTDRNERQIVNYEKYTIDGIAGSINYGQFIQINVVSVKPH